MDYITPKHNKTIPTPHNSQTQMSLPSLSSTKEHHWRKGSRVLGLQEVKFLYIIIKGLLWYGNSSLFGFHSPKRLLQIDIK